MFFVLLYIADYIIIYLRCNRGDFIITSSAGVLLMGVRTLFWRHEGYKGRASAFLHIVTTYPGPGWGAANIKE